MRDRVQMRVSTGKDPSTGERITLVDSVPIQMPGNARSERAALKEAEKLRTVRLLAQCGEADSSGTLDRVSRVPCYARIRRPAALEAEGRVVTFWRSVSCTRCTRRSPTSQR